MIVDPLQKAKQAVADAVGTVKPGGTGKTTCPNCGEPLHWFRSQSGRTVLLFCETDGCVDAKFNLGNDKTRAVWPGVNGMEVKGNA